MKKRMLLIAAVLPHLLLLHPLAASVPPDVPPVLKGLSGVQSVYPVEVLSSADGTEVRKIYDLAAKDDPAAISRADFVQGGFSYALTDLLRIELPVTERKAHIEAVTLTSDSRDTEKVLALLAKTKEVTTKDGFTGTLSLDTTTIRVEVADYGTSTKSVSATRSYPNLSDADMQHIPKTITENGRTLSLQDVQWETDNTHNVDDSEIADRYTAKATYGGTATSSYVKGYTVRASYSGEVQKSSMGKVRYIAVFAGTPVQREYPPLVARHIALAALVLLLMGGSFYSGRKVKKMEVQSYEKAIARLVREYGANQPRIGTGV